MRRPGEDAVKFGLRFTIASCAFALCLALSLLSLAVGIGANRIAVALEHARETP